MLIQHSIIVEELLGSTNNSLKIVMLDQEGETIKKQNVLLAEKSMTLPKKGTPIIPLQVGLSPRKLLSLIKTSKYHQSMYVFAYCQPHISELLQLSLMLMGYILHSFALHMLPPWYIHNYSQLARQDLDSHIYLV